MQALVQTPSSRCKGRRRSCDAAAVPQGGTVQHWLPTPYMAFASHTHPHNMPATQPSGAAPESSSSFAIIWMFAAIVLLLLIIANFSFGLLSSARAYVG